MTREYRLHLRWLTALAVIPACGDDGAVASSGSSTEGDADTSESDTVSVTITTADESSSDGSTMGSSSGSSSEGPTTMADTSSSSSEGSSSSGSDASSSSSGGSSTDTTGRDCGNDVIEGAEVCDGSDVGDATCEGEGFGPGELTCAADCTALDTSGCAPLAECGNGLLEDGELCDDLDLGDQTCADQGFDAGDLACADDCTFDVTGCVNFSCGDGQINGLEACDGAQLPDGASCADAGFGAGQVGCTDNCALDFSNCCGDGNVGDAELCDGGDLDGQTCQSQGDFDGGSLACAATCDGFDTSACTLCGDDVAAGTEVCDGLDLAGQDCTTVPGGFLGGALACDASCGFDTSGCNLCGNAVIDGAEACDGVDLGTNTCLDLGHTGGVLACAPGCAFDETGCTDFPLPQVAEIVITEVMQNPTAIDDTNGEWFELYNPSLVETFELRGCTVEGGGMGESFVIDADLQIDAGEYLTLATGPMPGFVPDYAWPGAFALVNGSDTVRLVCGGVTIDEITYDDGATFPDPAGASMQLEPTTTDTVANDDGTNWCPAQAPFGPGDLGTPGAANASCLATEYTVDFCRLQFPTNVVDLEGTPVDVFGRLFIGGLTDQSGVNDPAVNVQMQVGYGGDGTDPAVDAGWTWTSGTTNASYGPASPSYEANNDEYVATMPLPVPGTYDFAVRFTGDGGATYTYCDGGDAGSSNGYSAADAGQLTSQPGGSPTALYFSEYYEGTSSNKAIEIYNSGASSVNLAGCDVHVYANGGVAPTSTIALAGTVNPDDVFVLCNTSLAGQAFCDQGSGALTFNGDDAVDLVCDAVTIDVFGQIGLDPGAEWTGGVPPVGTVDEDVRRRCTVTQGDTNGGDAFDPSVEWTSLPVIAANPQPENVADLGLYVCQ